MSRESDNLMLRLPTADVAAWLRQELRDTPMTSYGREMLRLLIAKLGHDELKGESDAE